MLRFLDVDPKTLVTASHLRFGPDLMKLHRQIIRFGTSTAGMPPILVNEDSDGRLQIVDGMTRASRVAKLCPGTLVTVQILSTLRDPLPYQTTVGDVI